jgi:hypothetical protein
MTVNGIVRGLFNRREQLGREAGIDLDDLVALDAPDVVMVRITTDSVAIGTPSRRDAIEHSVVYQYLNRSVNRCPADTGIQPLKLLPEILHCKGSPALASQSKALRDEASRMGVTKAKQAKKFQDCLCREATGMREVHLCWKL